MARKPVLARVIGVLFVLGGTLGILSLLLPHPPDTDDRMLLLLDVVGLTTGAVYLLAARRIPLWLIHVAVAGAAVLICSAIEFSGLSSGLYSTLFFWIVLFCAVFFSRLATALHLVWLLLCYAGVLTLVEDAAGYSPITRWVLTCLALSVTGALTSWLVSRRREAEERSERFFQLSRDMLCMANVDGYFVEVNPAWTATLGYAEAELLSRPFVDFVHPDDRPRTEAEAARVLAGAESVEFENRYRAADGSWHWLMWSAKLSPEHGLIYARATDVTERKRLEAEREELMRELDAQARTDSLTGLPNRRWLVDELDRELARAERQHHDLCVAMIDVDHFKRFNDRYGHGAGDDLLRGAAERWRTTLRVSDFLARYGGEEFIVLLPDTDAAGALTVIERLRAATPAGQTCSAGIAMWDRHESPGGLVARADAALYEAKAQGRNRVRRAEPAVA